MNSKNSNGNEIQKVEAMVARCLQIGVVLSAIIIFAGLMLFLFSGRSGYTAGVYPTDLRDVIQGAIMLRPYAVILTGLFILILTPVLRVAVSILAFWVQKDYLYVIITAVVLVILIIGFLLGKAGQ